MKAVIRTPDLGRALADYTGRFGFTCRQHIPGVLAILDHGPLALQLWACGAPPGRWEQADPRQPAFAPEHHSIAVHHIHALHASLRRAVSRAPADPTLRVEIADPRLKAWGAWEFSFQDLDGHVLHCVDWGLHTRCLMDPLLDDDQQEEGP
jgi:hypothetical protein